MATVFKANPVHDEPGTGAARPAERRRGSARVRRIALGAVAVIGLVGGGYLGGRVHGWTEQRETAAQLAVAVDEHERAFDKLQSRHGQALAAVQKLAEQRERRIGELDELASLYEGLRLTHQALFALDARNFGVAESHLRAAEGQLTTVSDHVPKLQPVTDRLAATNVAVAGNLAAQREELMSIVSALDAIVTAERATLSARPHGSQQVAAGQPSAPANVDALPAR